MIGTTSPAPSPEYPTGFRLAVILISLFLGTFLVAVDTTIVSVAIPKISTEFHTLSDVGWYGSAYLISITALQPAGGTIYKFFNVKLVYLASILVFEAGSALYAAAPSSPIFILGRAIAGTGAAGLIQGAITVITYSSPLEKRPLYIGLVVSRFGISACFSPTLGGVLTDRVSWRWCFWINLPIGAVVFILVFLGLNTKAQSESTRTLPLKKKLKQLDPFGVILILAAVCCLFLALQWGGNDYPWNSSKVIGLLVGFPLLFFAFCILQWQLGDKATIPPRMLRERTVIYGALALFFISMSSNIKLYYLPFYFQAAQGASVIQSGVRFLALAAPQVVATVIAGGLATKTGHYFPIMLVGQIVCSVGTGLLVLIGTSTPVVEWAAYMALAGFGDGMCTNMPYTAIQAILADENDVYIGNSIATFVTLAGGAIGISVGGNLLISELISTVPKHTSSIPPQAVIQAGALNLNALTSSPDTLLGLREAYSEAISVIMICATVTICTSVLATFGMRPVNLQKVSKEREAAKQRPSITGVPDGEEEKREGGNQTSSWRPATVSC